MWKHQSLATFFGGQSSVTVALIANNAAQGILSSFFYKARLHDAAWLHGCIACSPGRPVLDSTTGQGCMHGGGGRKGEAAARSRSLHAAAAGLPGMQQLLPRRSPQPAPSSPGACCPQFADTILKKYSSVLGTIFTALMSWMLFDHSLSINFAIGVSIVFISMHQVGGGRTGG